MVKSFKSKKTERLEREVKNISKDKSVKEYKSVKEEQLKKSKSSDKSFDKLKKSGLGKGIGISIGGKLLKSPKAKIQSKDILKTLKQSSNYQTIRNERLEDTEYNKSPYFNEEYRKEKKESIKWLS